MYYRKINIIEFPSNLGLKKPDSAVEPGVKKLPEWLMKFGLYEKIGPEQVSRLEPPEYGMELDVDSGVRNADKIAEYAKDQSELMTEILREDTFPLVIGGDCSILVGNALALKQKGNYGLFFLDGHTDFILPEQSRTGGAAGMDLAIATGHGHDKLTDLLGLKPYFKETNVFCVGNREYDEGYVSPILQSDIHYFDLERLRKNGLENTAGQFLEMVENQSLDGFFIHIDVDVLNDEIMRAVDSRKEDGLNYQEFVEVLKPLFASKKAVGAEITILDPDLDRNGEYTEAFIKNFSAIVEHRKANM